MNFVDNEELADRQKRQERKQKRDLFWNVMTGLVVLAAVALVGYLAILFSNPYLGLNPFPPPTMPVLVDLSKPTQTPEHFASPTATLYVLPPTWTPTLGITETPRPTATPTPEPTFAATYGEGVYPFELESNPIPMAGTVFHTDGNCNWQGVAGRVVDMDGNPQPNIRVHLQGVYDGKTVDLTSLTGLAKLYGDSGFEFVLGTKALDSSDLLAIQLEDQSFLPISGQVILDTYADCTRNLMLVNFKQVR